MSFFSEVVNMRRFPFIAAALLVALFSLPSISSAQDGIVCSAVLPFCKGRQVVAPFMHGQEGECYEQDRLFCLQSYAEAVVEDALICEADGWVEPAKVDNRMNRCYKKANSSTRLKSCLRKIIKKARVSARKCEVTILSK